jgi:hypothetical protein
MPAGDIGAREVPRRLEVCGTSKVESVPRTFFHGVGLDQPISPASPVPIPGADERAIRGRHVDPLLAAENVAGARR